MLFALWWTAKARASGFQGSPAKWRPIEMKQTLSAFIHRRRRFWQSSPLADVRATLGDPKSFMKLAKKHNAEDRAKMEKPRDDDKKPDDDSKGDDANA